MKRIDAADLDTVTVTPNGGGLFVAEASQIAWQPGCWPKSVAIFGIDRDPVVVTLRGVDDHLATYEADRPAVTLEVLND